MFNGVAPRDSIVTGLAFFLGLLGKGHFIDGNVLPSIVPATVCLLAGLGIALGRWLILRKRPDHQDLGPWQR